MGRFLKSHLLVRLIVLHPGMMKHWLEGKGTNSVKAKSSVFRWLVLLSASLTEILITWVLFRHDCDSNRQETIAGSQICVIKGLGTAAVEGFQQY